MTKFPLVSVVIPVYNHEVYIEKAINSVLEQDYPNIEIIVINDESTDQSEALALRFLEKGNRPFQVISQKNAGAHAAINHGIEITHGEYIAILNSDDYYLPQRLTIMINEMIGAHKRFAYSKVIHIDPEGQPHPYQEVYEKQIAEAEQFPTISFELLRNNIAVTTGNFIFHRSLIEEVGTFSSLITTHDWDFLLRVILYEEPLFINEILLAYRIHSGGSLQHNLEKVNQEIEQLFINFLKNSNRARNQLAPTLKNWGDYWLFFSQTFLNRVCELPRVKELVDRISFSNISKIEEDFPLTSSNVRSNFIPLDTHSDLDLTQININSLSPRIIKSEKKQSRLLIIIPWMVMGGAERFLLNTIDELLEDGWEISILCTSPSENNWRSEFEKRSDKIIVLPEILAVKHYVRFIRYWLDRFDFDAIMIQGSIEGYRLSPVIRHLYPKIPIIDYLHFITPDWMDGGFPRLSTIYRDCLDLSITSCEQVQNWMVVAGGDENRLRVCPIGVDHTKWKPNSDLRTKTRQEFGFGEKEVVIVYAARLEAQKQPLIFAETMKVLSTQGVEFQAIVAGDGSLKETLEEYISKNKLENRIRIIGSISEDQMQALLNAGDIFFLPSQNEGISAAIYEAMSTGIPVVASDVGGQVELVTVDCGILLPVIPVEQQPEAYAHVLKGLIWDGNLRMKLKHASRKRIMNGFTLQQSGDRFIQILHEVVNEKQKNKEIDNPLTPDELFLRNSQQIIEYLQARQEWHKADNQILDLSKRHKDGYEKFVQAIGPRPASFWFYLWIRQLFLPTFNKIKSGFLGKIIRKNQKWLKERILKV
ncbi:MAG: glycosyltransferase [Anaerolineaceae bacterium]|nr:glycosyltransferase [Anaerolineaceae bacterium]